jgi:tRNA threonylcarbamoyl adenosine modification protein YeaZ
MRLLAIETSSRRGSVALLEDGTVTASQEHDCDHRHAERILPMIECLLEQARWSRRSIERVAVGIGPGSFTGVRVGMALAEGVAAGLRIDTVGVCSLEAMAGAVPPDRPGVRIACLDAGRGEVFIAAFGPSGQRAAPRVIAAERAVQTALEEAGQPADWIACGEIAPELARERAYRSAPTDLPHAAWVGLIGANRPRQPAAAQPLYLRGANATRPDLPPSPLSSPRR